MPFEHPENRQVRTPLSSGNDRDLGAILGGEGSLVALLLTSSNPQKKIESDLRQLAYLELTLAA